MNKALKITYWTTTSIFAIMMSMSAILQITMQPAMITSFHNLNFPPSLMLLLGVLKALGVITLMFPGLRGLKEWAYAGFTFLLVGAAFSHYTVADYTPVPLVMLVILAVSYITYKRKDAVKKPLFQTN